MAKTFSWDEALSASIDYFNGDKLAAEVFLNKYALKGKDLELLEKTPKDMHRRLAKEFAKVEKKFKNPLSEEEIFSLFDRFKYIVPQGSPMFGIGNKSQLVSLSNCFVIDCVDSYGGICKADERLAQISKRRGGVGLDISPIRPKGLSTNNSSLTTDGIGLFMERFSNTIREVGQHGRRGALLLSISVHHPEVMTFIKIKRDLKKVTGANISVRVSDEFMKAVINEKEYEQRWPVDSDNPTIKGMANSKEVWEELVKSNYLSAEPGILFWDSIVKNSPADCYVNHGFRSLSTNPCLTGDTLIYVADGRGNVPIKTLADEGKDVPVFCYDKKNKLAIRTMRNPRITGHNKAVYKVTLDDGSVFRATENHKLLTTKNGYKRVDELESGDGLKTITKYVAPMPSSIKSESGSRSKTEYNWIANGFGDTRAEHRYIAEYFTEKKLDKKTIVHHIDFNGLNNTKENLVIMGENEHNKLHASDKIGDKNPMRRAKTEWPKEKWKQYHDNISESVSGSKNGRAFDVTCDEIREHAIKLTKNIGRRFSRAEWIKYAKENKLPVEFSDWRKNELGRVLDLAKWSAIKCELLHTDEDPRVVRTLQSMLEQGYNAFIKDGFVFVKRICEECGCEFTATHYSREVCFCGSTCSNNYRYKNGEYSKQLDSMRNTYEKKMELRKEKQIDIYNKLKFDLHRNPLMKEWEGECKKQEIPFRVGTKCGFSSFKALKENAKLFNHRVVSVELDGYEDVYNGTVDDFHNFFFGSFEGLTKNKKKKYVFVNSQNCGELPLPSGDACRLLLQNLTSYVENPFTEDASFDWDLFKKNTRVAEKLMDDLVEMELEAIQKIINKIKADPEPDHVKANELSMWSEIYDKCRNGRRTGLGTTGLGDTIAMLNMKYGDEDSLKLVAKIYKTMRNEAYRSSIEMAKERGAFPIYNHDTEKDNEYLKRLPKDIKEDIEKYGRRNISLLTNSPAGSVSVLTQTSSGFEPVYKAVYFRKRKIMSGETEEPDFIDSVGDKWKEYPIYHHGLKKFIEITGKTFEESPYEGAEAGSIDHMNRVKMQSTAQKYIDHSISSTVNLPNDIKLEVVNDLYIEAWKSGCKGLTIYRDGSRDGVLTAEKTSTRECVECDDASKQLVELIRDGKRPNNIILSSAPSRSEILKCDIHRSKVGGGDWLFFVGLLNGTPYEVFGGDSEEFIIPKKYKDGWIVKNGKLNGITQYHLALGSLEDENEKLVFKGIAKHFNNYEYGAFTRLTSLAIRHGIAIQYICEQITKRGVDGDLFSFQRAMARILKKYIVEGEKAGIECPDCGSTEVVYKNGCPNCMICGYSKCA